MMSESDKCILSKDISSVTSMADVLFPEKTVIGHIIILNIGIGIGFKLCVLVHH